MTEPDRRRLRLLHTSDVHIGDELDPGWRMAGLGSVVDAAIAADVDALLIAGDLFDNARVRPEDIDATLEHLARLQVPVVLTPGNHDCLGSPSIYSRVRPTDAGDHVSFLADPEGSHLVLEHLDVTFWARGLVDHHPEHYPLEGYSRHVEEHWQVALAHGHFVSSMEGNYRSSPLPGEHIGSMTCDYLALGHWHHFQEVSVNGTRAFYCGSPNEGGAYPSANLVTFDMAEGVSVERLELPKHERHLKI